MHGCPGGRAGLPRLLPTDEGREWSGAQGLLNAVTCVLFLDPRLIALTSVPRSYDVAARATAADQP